MARSLLVALVCVLLVATGLGLGVVAPGMGTGNDDGSSVGSPVTTQEGFATTVFQVEVFENGSAQWTFRYTRPLENESEREQFRTFAERFNTEETELYTNFQDRARRLTEAGREATGRNMSAEGFRRDARVNSIGNRGVVELFFRWEGFARVDGDRVQVGDVFEGGFYVGSDQWIVFEAGPGLGFDPATVEPQPDEYSGETVAGSDTLTWFGQRQFTDNHPRLALVPADTITTSSGGESTTGSDDTPDDGGSGGEGSRTVETTTTGGGASGAFPMLLVGIIVVVAGLGAAAAWRTGVFGGSGDPGGGATTADSGDAGGGVEAESAEADAGEAEPAVPDEELLTDEDRVLALLEENGGRMKQTDIVEETGWSKSKVSMLLSDMEEEEGISKLRVGRENIVSLSGHEPDAAGSPFDDE